MNRYPDSRRKIPTWLKWSFLLLFIILISFVTMLSFFYQDIMANKTAGFDDTKERVMQQTEINKIDTISRFHGDEYYQVVQGKSAKLQDMLVFVPIYEEDEEKKEEDFFVVNMDEIMDSDSVVELWKKDCADCLFIHIKAAFIDENPLWEITYKDTNNRYVMDYVSMYDGSRFEQLRLRKTFK